MRIRYVVALAAGLALTAGQARAVDGSTDSDTTAPVETSTHHGKKARATASTGAQKRMKSPAGKDSAGSSTTSQGDSAAQGSGSAALEALDTKGATEASGSADTNHPADTSGSADMGTGATTGEADRAYQQDSASTSGTGSSAPGDATVTDHDANASEDSRSEPMPHVNDEAATSKTN